MKLSLRPIKWLKTNSFSFDGVPYGRVHSIYVVPPIQHKMRATQSTSIAACCFENHRIRKILRYNHRRALSSHMEVELDYYCGSHDSPPSCERQEHMKYDYCIASNLLIRSIDSLKWFVELHALYVDIKILYFSGGPRPWEWCITKGLTKYSGIIFICACVGKLDYQLELWY